MERIEDEFSKNSVNCSHSNVLSNQIEIRLKWYIIYKFETLKLCVKGFSLPLDEIEYICRGFVVK